MATGAFIAASALAGAGIGGVVSKAQGGDFWKGALVGGLTGAATGGIGAFTSIGATGGASSVLSSITGSTGSAALKAAGSAALRTSLLAGGATMLAGGLGVTQKKTETTSASDVEEQAASTYSSSQVKALTVSELQQGNTNILGTFGNETSTFTRARLLNY